MFPNYVFAAVDGEHQSWRTMLSTFGVRTVIRSGDAPSLLPQDFVDAFKCREINGAISRPDTPYKIGQDVRLLDGAFHGVVGRVIGLCERDRLVVLLSLLQRSVQTTISVAQVAEIA